MFTPTIRIVLILFSLSMAVYFYTTGDYLRMSMMLIAAGLFIYGYFKYGPVYVACQQLKKENYSRAEKLLSSIKHPENLSSRQKGYYHFAKGIIASNMEDWDNGFAQLNKAMDIGLRTKNDTSIVLLNLAEIEFNRKNHEHAESFLEKLKEFPLEPSVQSEVIKLQSKIYIAQEHI